jgi:hypothetical protein
MSGKCSASEEATSQHGGRAILGMLPIVCGHNPKWVVFQMWI